MLQKLRKILGAEHTLFPLLYAQDTHNLTEFCCPLWHDCHVESRSNYVALLTIFPKVLLKKNEKTGFKHPYAHKNEFEFDRSFLDFESLPNLKLSSRVIYSFLELISAVQELIQNNLKPFEAI